MKIAAKYFGPENIYSLFREFNGSIDDKRFAGSFGHTDNSHANSYFFDLCDFDKEYVKNVTLKKGEEIYRCETDMTRKLGIRYFIKINLERSLVYYMTEQAWQEDVVIFETRGLQMTYLNIFENPLKGTQLLK